MEKKITFRQLNVLWLLYKYLKLEKTHKNTVKIAINSLYEYQNTKETK